MAIELPEDAQELRRRTQEICHELAPLEADAQREQLAWKEATSSENVTPDAHRGVIEVWSRYKAFAERVNIAAFPINELRICLFLQDCAVCVPVEDGFVLIGNALSALAHMTSHRYPSHSTEPLSTTLLPSVIKIHLRERYDARLIESTGPPKSQLEGKVLNRELLNLTSIRREAPGEATLYECNVDGLNYHFEFELVDQLLRLGETVSAELIQLCDLQRDIAASAKQMGPQISPPHTRGL